MCQVSPFETPHNIMKCWLAANNMQRAYTSDHRISWNDAIGCTPNTCNECHMVLLLKAGVVLHHFSKCYHGKLGTRRFLQPKIVKKCTCIVSSIGMKVIMCILLQTFNNCHLCGWRTLSMDHSWVLTSPIWYNLLNTYSLTVWCTTLPTLSSMCSHDFGKNVT